MTYPVEHPLVQGLLAVAHDLEEHHGLAFEYADGSLADELQRLDFEQSHANLKRVLAALSPDALPLLHPLAPARTTALAFLADAPGAAPRPPVPPEA